MGTVHIYDSEESDYPIQDDADPKTVSNERSDTRSLRHRLWSYNEFLPRKTTMKVSTLELRW